MDSNLDPRTSNLESETRIDRRQLLALTGAGAASILAGCVGGNTGDGDLVSNEFVQPWYGVQDDLQWNEHNATLSPTQFIARIPFVDIIVHNNIEGEFYPVGLQEYTIDGEKFNGTVQEGLTWHNGDPVTGEDVARTLKINYYMGTGINNFVGSAEDIYADGDRSVVVEFDDQYLPIAPEAAIAGDHTLISHPEDVYGEYVEQFEDATTDEERDTVRADIAEFTWTDPEPLANGPLEIESVDNRGVHASWYEDYPWAEMQDKFENEIGVDMSAFPDEPNFDNWTRRFFAERPSGHQAAIAGDLSAGPGIEIDSLDIFEQEYPDDAELLQANAGWIDGFVWNFVNGDHVDMWRNRNVRKAFYHILDFEGITHQLGGETASVEGNVPSGMSEPMRGTINDEEFLDSLTEYESDPQRATELLTEAGLTEEDGQWYKPNGEPFEVIFKAGSTVQYQIDGMEFAASNLSEFGIQSDVEIIEGTTYFGETVPQLNYELARNTTAHYNIADGWENTWILYDNANQDEQPLSHYIEEPAGEPGLEVPPVGEPDSSETITIDPTANVEELLAESDEERIEELQKELAWAFNQTVPVLEVAGSPSDAYITQKWKYPGKDHTLSGIRPYASTLPQIGAIAAKEPDEYEF